MIRYKRSFLPAIFLAIVSASCSSPDRKGGNTIDSLAYTDSVKLRDTTVSTDWLLIPGASAGATKINEDASLVLKRLGKPDGGDAAMGKTVAWWHSKGPEKKYSTAIYTVRQPIDDSIARVRQIRVTSPEFKTKEGLGVGSALAELEQAFRLQANKQFKPVQVYDTSEGIAFEFAENSEKCNAVVIYEKGIRLPEAYLNLRDADK